jgi:2,3-bisphosphoglycerate-dependent phosphoglycerate mutase
MRKLTFLLFAAFLLQACSTTSYFIVRHCEKEAQNANMTSDVPLSAAGKERAEALKTVLQSKKVQHIYSTNTLRTKSTAQPLSEAIGVSIQTYDHRDTSFVTKLKKLSKGNVLIVGHSNTIDEMVNQFYPKAQLKDLPDSQYGDLFIINRKGNNYSYKVGHFGK